MWLMMFMGSSTRWSRPHVLITLSSGSLTLLVLKINFFLPWNLRTGCVFNFVQGSICLWWVKFKVEYQKLRGTILSLSKQVNLLFYLVFLLIEFLLFNYLLGHCSISYLFDFTFVYNTRPKRDESRGPRGDDANHTWIRKAVRLKESGYNQNNQPLRPLCTSRSQYNRGGLKNRRCEGKKT